MTRGPFRLGGSRLRRLTDHEASLPRQHADAWRHLDRHPRSASLLAGAMVATPAWIWAGPVAGAIAAIYAAVGVVLAVRRRREVARDASAAIAMDAFVMLAARLRAGGDVVAVTSAVLPGMRAGGAMGRRLADRVGVACRVAEVTGARLADLLDRIETDARGAARLRTIAAAQASGAQATAWLLAGLPVGGIALGYGIGADPLHVLLRTRVGALCAGVAIAFQMTGLAWTHRLTRQTRESA